MCAQRLLNEGAKEGKLGWEVFLVSGGLGGVERGAMEFRSDGGDRVGYRQQSQKSTIAVRYGVCVDSSID